MSGILLTVVIFGLLPVCLKKPWIGILLWYWIGYMNPHRLVWGLAHEMPFAQIVAITTLVGFILSREYQPLPRTKEMYIFLAMWVVFLLSTIFAFYPEEAWVQFIKVSKIIFVTFLTILLFQDKKRLKILLWVTALSIGFYGLKGGIWAVGSGGKYMVLGPTRSFISDNTQIGMALNMILPFLFFLRLEETLKWRRHLLLVTFIFSIIAILITYSRGALLGLISVSLFIFLKSRAKIAIIILLIICIPFAISKLPDTWFGKMDTIQHYEEDGSAMGRLTSWRMSYYMALDRPLFGGGFYPFSKETYDRYLPEAYNKRIGAHSIYFSVLAEHGFTGLIFFVSLILTMIMSLRRIERKYHNDSSRQWLYNYAQMLQASTIAYAVSGAFLNMAYFDLFYLLVALTIILKKLAQDTEVAQVEHDQNLLKES